MSIAQDTQAMQAKLQGNTQALQAMAAQGNMAALLALKEMLDQQQYAQSMKANAAMQTPEMEPVLNQMASGLQAAQTQRAFADAGMADTKIGFSWEADPNVTPLQRLNYANMARRGQVAGPVTQRDVFLAQQGHGADRLVSPGVEETLRSIPDKLQQWFSSVTQGPNYSNEGNNYPAAQPPANPDYSNEGKNARAPTNRPITGGTSKPSGLAAAVGAGTPKPHADTGPVPPVTIIPLPPPDATESELAAYQAQLAQFAEDRKALSAKQRKMLDDQYARQAKSMTPDKGQRFWDFLANVGAVGGKSAGRALAQGAVKTRDAERQRQAALQLLEAAHAKEKMLLDQSELAAKEGDAAKAYQLRQEAGKIKLEREKAESQMKLQDSQIRENDAQTRNQDAQAKGEGHWKPKTTTTAVGGKPMTEAAKASWITKAIDRMAKAEAGDFERTAPPSTREQLMAKAKAELAMITGVPAPGGASASPAGKRIKFGDL